MIAHVDDTLFFALRDTAYFPAHRTGQARDFFFWRAWGVRWHSCSTLTAQFLHTIYSFTPWFSSSPAASPPPLAALSPPHIFLLPLFCRFTSWACAFCAPASFCSLSLPVCLWIGVFFSCCFDGNISLKSLQVFANDRFSFTELMNWASAGGALQMSAVENQMSHAL